MFDFRRMKPLDIALFGLGTVVVLLALGLGIGVWSHNARIRNQSPVGRATLALEKSVKKNPKSVDLRMQLAQTYMVAGRSREAIVQYEAVLKSNPKYIPALSGLGFAAMKSKQWKVAEGYWLKVIETLAPQERASLNRQLETAYFYMGTALMEQRQYEEAVGYYKEALRIRRDASDTHFALAYCYKRMGAESLQLEELEITVAYDPKHPEGNYELGLLKLVAGDEARAAELFRISANNAPGVEKPQDALEKLGPYEDRLAKARAFEKAKKWKEALPEARIAVALEPNDIVPLLLLARVREGLKQTPQAAAAYRKALVMDARNAEAEAGLKRTGGAK